jgi:serine/threonine protein kinase/tetratricopeptide (TPR) repeat protein
LTLDETVLRSEPNNLDSKTAVVPVRPSAGDSKTDFVLAKPPASESRPDTAPVAATPSGSRTGPVSAHDETLMPAAGSRTTQFMTAGQAASSQSVPGYEILGVLGRGGMGVVYKARQIKLNRLVALKMIRSASHAGPDDLARFRSEAEAVARLQHPNIVQIFEVGEQDGQPFCALELVEGGNLQQLVKGEPQPARRAAELVETLARAIDHAHRQGIVHRDLKPGNILLASKEPRPESPEPKTGRPTGLSTLDSQLPTPKITDFGLAKRLDDDDLNRTGTGSVLGTPTFMAPEQAAGRTRDIGPAADIYALGAILYDLLTGRPPLRGESVVDTLQLVQTAEPVPPSRLQPRVPRDLETICLKCLRKLPATRYASAAALADDLRRFLNGEPIVARPVPAWERATKWARRRPAAAALLAVSVLALVGAAVGGLAYARLENRRANEAMRLRAEAERERNRANQERDKAIASGQIAEENFRHARDAVELMLTRVGQEKLAHEPRMERIRRDLLSGALTFYQRFLQERGSDPGLRWETARAYLRVGDIRDLLGEQQEAEKAYRSAIALLGELEAQEPDHPDYRRDRAMCLNNLGNLLNKASRLPEAEQAYRDALAIRQQLDSAEDRRALAATCNNLATLLQTRHQFSEAERSERQALNTLARLVAEFPKHAQYLLEQARCQGNLGELLAKTGHPADAEKLLKSSRSTFQQLAKNDPAVPDYRTEFAVGCDRLGNLWRDTQPPEAERAYRQGLTWRERLVDDFPTVPGYRQGLANSHNNLAIFLHAAGKQAAADQAYRTALTIQEKLVADYPRVPDFRRDLASSLANRAILLQQQNRLADAEAAYRDALERQERLAADFPLIPEFRQDRASTLLNFAVLLESTQRPAEAEETCRQGLALREQLVEAFPQVPVYRQELARGLLQLGTLCQLHGKPDEAEKQYGKAVELFGKLVDGWPGVPDYRHELAVVLQNHAGLLQASKHPQLAERALRRSTELLAGLIQELPSVPAYRQERGRALNELAMLLAAGERFGDARDSWNDAIAVQEKLVTEFADQPAYGQELARSLCNRGILEVQTGQTARAEESFQRAETLFQELTRKYPNLPAYWQELIGAQQNLVNLLAAAERREAEDAWSRLVASEKMRWKRFPTQTSFGEELAQVLIKAGEFSVQRDKTESGQAYFTDAAAEYRSLLRSDPRRPPWRQGLGRSLLGLAELQTANDDAAAAGSAREAAALLPPDGAEAIRTAAVFARCAKLVTKEGKLSKEERAKKETAYATEAVAVLRRAAQAGYRDIGTIERTEAFAALRERPDFQKFVRDLAGRKE